MATEAFTNYPLPPWPQHRDDGLTGIFDRQVLDRLGAIEERLSQIELLLSQQQPKE